MNIGESIMADLRKPIVQFIIVILLLGLAGIIYATHKEWDTGNYYEKAKYTDEQLKLKSKSIV